MPSPIRTVVLDSLRDFSPQAAARRVTLLTEVEASLGLGVAESEFRAILRELIDNAVRYTPPGGWVRITGQPERGEALFSVKDSGSGITRSRLDSFMRGSSGGLARAAGVIRRHGGRFWANSKPGKGSTFYFTFPRTK